MLKKLRIKFIIINMVIVSIMLCFIFGLLYFSTRRNLEMESIQMMNSIAMNPKRLAPPSEKRDDVRLPYFSILVNRDGETMEIDGGLFDLSDGELLDEILAKTDGVGTETGILQEYKLRFSIKETPMGKCYVFADISSEQVLLNNLIKTLSITGGTAFLIFLGISVLLASWAVKPVEQAWVQQKQFVADASHELKTPLTVIMTDAELLRSEECTISDRRELSDSIITVSGQMRGLVESLLELARIDSGQVSSMQGRISFSDIARESAMLFDPVFFEKRLPFSYDITPELILTGNCAHLKQLVEIFLDNAVKYSSPGGETVLSLQRVSAKKCRLSVSNQGEPIAQEELKNLFKRFYRVDKVRTSCHSYGLGLSIAESIVEEHRGTIWAESRNGYNSFHAELPL